MRTFVSLACFLFLAVVYAQESSQAPIAPAQSQLSELRRQHLVIENVPNGPPPRVRLNYMDLEAMAKQAMVDVTNIVSDALSKKSFNTSGLKPKQVEFLYEVMGKHQISPNILFNKCIMKTGSITAIQSTVWTTANDDVGPNIKALLDVKENYNDTVWKLASGMCEASMNLFAFRLGRATSGGTRIDLEKKQLQEAARIVFFPWLYGRPTFKKSLFQVADNFFSASMIAGSILAVANLPAAEVAVSLDTAASTGLDMRDSLGRAENKLSKLDFSILSRTDYVSIDLSPEEQALLPKISAE